MKHVTVNTARKDFDGLIDNVTQDNEPITIVSADNKAAVLVSMAEWRNLQETLYLQSVPGLVKAIKAAAAEPLEDGMSASEVDFDV